MNFPSYPLLVANYLGLPSPVPLHLGARRLCIRVNMYDLRNVMHLRIVAVLWSILVTGIPVGTLSTLVTARSTTTIPACQGLTIPLAL